MTRWITLGLCVAVVLLAPVIVIAGGIAAFSGGGPGTLARISDTGAVGLAIAAQQAGFQGEGLRIAVAVGLAESGGNPAARNPNPPTPGCPTGSVDRGGWQLNDCYHAEVPDACAYQLACAAVETYRISAAGTDWTPWVTFTTGSWQAQVAAANRAIAALQTATAVSGIPGGSDFLARRSWWGGALRRGPQLSGWTLVIQEDFHRRAAQQAQLRQFGPHQLPSCLPARTGDIQVDVLLPHALPTTRALAEVALTQEGIKDVFEVVTRPQLLECAPLARYRERHQ